MKKRKIYNLCCFFQSRYTVIYQERIPPCWICWETFVWPWPYWTRMISHFNTSSNTTILNCKYFVLVDNLESTFYLGSRIHRLYPLAQREHPQKKSLVCLNFWRLVNTNLCLPLWHSNQICLPFWLACKLDLCLPSDSQINRSRIYLFKSHAKQTCL